MMPVISSSKHRRRRGGAHTLFFRLWRVYYRIPQATKSIQSMEVPPQSPTILEANTKQDKHDSPPHTPKPPTATVHAQPIIARAPLVWNSKSHKDPTKTDTLNIFDFDGTLFRSPVPNKNMWQMTTWGQIEGKSDFGGIGWYQDVLTLSPPYVPSNPDDSWFIMEVLDEVKKSIANPNCLTVLLTGRSTAYQQILETILVTSRGLCFDYVGLKNTQDVRTIHYKANFITDIVKQHPSIKSIHIWEDRPPHVQQFNEILATQFPNHKGFVHAVNEDSIMLPPELERELVLKLIEKNSKEPKEVAFVPDYSGVEIDQVDSQRILSAFPPPPDYAPRAHHMTIALGGLRDPNSTPAGTSSFSSAPSTPTKEGESTPSAVAPAAAIVPGMFPKEGDRVRLEVFAFAQDEKVTAVKVSTVIKTFNAFPHITVSISVVGRAKHSNELTNWKELEPSARFFVNGTVKQFSKWAVITKKSAKVSASASGGGKPPPIGQLLKTHRSDIQGKQIGASVQLVREWLRDHPIEGDNLGPLEKFIKDLKLSDIPT